MIFAATETAPWVWGAQTKGREITWWMGIVVATAERASQQKVYSDISEVVKRAHVLAAEAEQLHTSIDAEDLGKPEAALAKVKEGLERRNLTPADLQALREQIVGLD